MRLNRIIITSGFALRIGYEVLCIQHECTSPAASWHAKQGWRPFQHGRPSGPSLQRACLRLLCCTAFQWRGCQPRDLALGAEKIEKNASFHVPALLRLECECSYASETHMPGMPAKTKHLQPNVCVCRIVPSTPRWPMHSLHLLSRITPAQPPVS